MGTNFYYKQRFTMKQRSELLKRLRGIAQTSPEIDLKNHLINEITDSIPEIIHLGKRSAGWQFLWDYHNGKYYEANLESIKAFVSNPDGDIYDEYGQQFTADELFNKELKGWLYEGKGHRSGLEGKYRERYFKSEDGLRFTIDEDFC